MWYFLAYVVTAIIVIALKLPGNGRSFKHYRRDDTICLSILYGVFWLVVLPVHALAILIVYLADNKSKWLQKVKNLGDKSES